MATDEMQDPATLQETIAFNHELFIAANLFAEHWEKLGPPTGASTAAFVLLAARVYASAQNPLTLEEFVHLATCMYERALEEAKAGDLIDADAHDAGRIPS